MKKSKSNKKKFISLGIVIVVCMLLWLSRGILGIGVLVFDYLTAKPSISVDISDYQGHIGKNADEPYKDKWGMDESIFPLQITDSMVVKDYKMVYYNPWDAQYLSCLVVQYNEEEYAQEIERLSVYPSNEYRGYYGAEGFDDQYELLAMCADVYQGFVYALTDKKDTITYVEMIFCNYFMDLDYKQYINEEFLPKGFDATQNNPYRKKMVGHKVE